MRVSVFTTPADLANANIDISNTYAIAIDVLRATSTIVTALNNGANAVIPVADVAGARKIHSECNEKKILLCGERNGNKLKGFDLGNSPCDYTKDRVADHTMIMSTTNGTKAIVSIKAAKIVAVGAMINAAYVAKEAIESGLPIVIVMAGTNRRFSLDDALAAGAILDAMSDDIILDDMGIICHKIYANNKNDIIKILKESWHFNILKDMGYMDDILYCMNYSIIDIVPKYKNGKITI